ncbi:MAG: YceH family protein [Bacteroidetes Order II. Incertae sedis bacterium]|nr:YceH family protein [Bacteroidetes Order II. bacterium]
MNLSEIKLDAIQVRVLASLIEKARTTPQNYPLSLNSLVAACNQKTSRNPVMQLDERSVYAAIEALQHKRLVQLDSASGRVNKYRQSLNRVIDLDPQELCILAVLMLRGEQTLGEIKGNATAMYHFESLEQAEKALNRLIECEEPLVVQLPKRPGRKEARFLHLMAGMPDLSEYENADHPSPPVGLDTGRMDKLEAEVSELRQELNALKAALGV